MSEIPHDPGVDNTRALLQEGYTFIARRCERYDSDIFSTRLLLGTAYCVRGEEAARMFYEPGRFTRRGAMPPTTQRLLQDQDSVQTLDGDAHRQRKRMFMELMNEGQMQRLAQAAEAQWHAALARWQNEDEIVLLDAARELLCRSACAWADVPLSASEARLRTREFGAMLDGAGSFGAQAARGLWLRRQTERWMQDVIQQIRDGELQPEAGAPAAVIAEHRDLDDELLALETAAVELINILRPIVAVARFVTYCALALHEYPQARAQLQFGGEHARHRFVQEVRRFYPFFPFIGGRVLTPFEWRGHEFKQGDWVLLDLYGTNHDARIWHEPQAFRPERFIGSDGNAWNFIPQGGGNVHVGHRCPGEAVTRVLMDVAVRMLTTAMSYDVPWQNLQVDVTQLPAAPAERMRMRNIKARNPG
ncbi:MAG TPA: cytochrome P450 [Salinisphaeraceae bacterium]|nr:cytochrome P450 [Salinisphaeraceae bacterium]